VARKRKTRAERDQERADAERRVWDAFRPRLDALQTFLEAKKLMAESPPPDAPGRRYYSNLAFFLQAFIVPMGSSYAEKALYVQFNQRLDAAGELKSGAGQKVIQDLESAMEAQGRW